MRANASGLEAAGILTGHKRPSSASPPRELTQEFPLDLTFCNLNQDVCDHVRFLADGQYTPVEIGYLPRGFGRRTMADPALSDASTVPVVRIGPCDHLLPSGARPMTARHHAPAKAEAAKPARETARPRAQPDAAAPNLHWLRLATAGGSTLALGRHDDPLEREADRVADVVMREDATQVRRMCAECADEERATVRRDDAGEADGGALAPRLAQQVQAARHGGEPLSPSVRAFFESRFGRDLGEVRIRRDAAAADAASALAARAYTIGRDIAFARGQYQPGTPAGRRLLAHELVHVAQQGSPAGRARSGSAGSRVARQPDDAGLGGETDAPAKMTLPADTGAAPTDTATPADDATSRDAGEALPAAAGGTPATAPAPRPSTTPLTVTSRWHAAAPPGMAPCPDAPPRNIVVVGCAAMPAAAPPAVEKAELPKLNPARFGGDADRAKFAKELAQCRAARVAKNTIDRRYRAAAEAARKQATAEAKQETEAAIKAATENIPPSDKGAIARAKKQAAADARKAAIKKIADAQTAVTRQNLATVTAELAANFEDELAADYDATMQGAIDLSGPGWLATMQRTLNRKRQQVSKEKSAKPKVARGETPPPAKSAEEIASEIEAEMVEVRCEQQQWVLNRIESVAHAWAVGRRGQVDFETIPQKAAHLTSFEPTYDPASQSRVDIPGTTGIAGVAPETADFLTRLAASVKANPSLPSFTATNRPGHGGGKVSDPRHFAGKGFSLDITIDAPTDQRGFWRPSTAVAFLLEVDATAKAMGARWRVLYNDFRVAQEVNAATGARNVVFVGSSGGRLNWHGPDPLLLHFHLDLEVPQKSFAPAGGAP